MRRTILTGLTIILSAWHIFATPTDSLLLDSITRQLTIQEVKVTAQRKTDNIMPVQRLSGERLQQLSVQSVADALRYFSGVQVKDYGGVGGIKTVDIRSMGSHHLGVFYDGIEIGNAQNGTVDLGKFSMDNLEEISLYNGQKSELLQSAKDYGSAGTLYLRTRRPVFKADKPYNIQVGMKAGTFGLANPSVLYEHKLTDNLHLSANAEYTYATGRYHFRRHQVYPDGTTAWDTVGIRQNGDVQSFRAETGLFGYLPRGKWHLKGYYYQSEKGIPRAIIRNVWTSSQRQWDRNSFVQGSFQDEWDFGERRIGDGHRTLRWLVSGKYSNDYMRYLNPDTTLMYIDNQFTQHEVYLTSSLQYDIFTWWGVSVSGDYQFNSLYASLVHFPYPRRHTGLVAAATAWHYKWIRAQASLLSSTVKDEIKRSTQQTQHAAERLQRFTPAVFLSYQPLLKEELYLRAFYKRVFRMPTFNDLYYTDVGNISLKPEDATQYDAGVEYTKTFTFVGGLRNLQLYAKADGYFNQVNNKIVAIPKGNSQYRWQMMNLGYVEITGVDINAGLTFTFAHHIEWNTRMTYTYQRARDLTDPNDPLTYGGQIAYIPRHSGSVTSCIAWNDWSLNYSFIYVGERYHNSANIPVNYEPSWYTHDLALAKLFRFRAWNLSASVEVNNLLNQQYDIILNYPMPGLNGKLVLKAIF